MLKILILVSSIHMGDMAQADALLKILAVEKIEIDANKSLTAAREEYLAKVKQLQKDEKYITLAIGEEAMKLLVYLFKTNAIDNSRSYNCLSIHQYFDVFTELKLDQIIIPEATIDSVEKRKILADIPQKTLVFAPLNDNPSKQELKTSYDNWHSINKPSLNGSYIIVMMPGDAPDPAGKMRYFTKASAKELFDDVYKLWESRGKKDKIIVQNGPRTGKHNPQTGKIASLHEYKLGENPIIAVDEVTSYFLKFLEGMDYSFFSFAIEVDGNKRRTISYHKQLLYLAQQNDNIFILPGGSVSSMGQIPLYLPSNRIILFQPSSMNETHKAVFNLAFKRNYLSYFAKNGDVIAPTKINQRNEDDAKLVAEDLLKGYKKKFENFN